jgi:putative endonuclease
MYYVYILKSEVNGDIYAGSTENIENRLKLHNGKKVRSTKAYAPWKLLDTQEFITRGEAFKQEHFLKSGQQKELLRKKYCR